MSWAMNPAKQVTECTPLNTRGPKRLWNAEGTSRRTRGEVGKLVVHDYLCPVHGRFEQLVPSSDAPDDMPCTVEGCGETSPWSPGRAPAAWKSSGEVTS
jgi:hypothetical protein